MFSRNAIIVMCLTAGMFCLAPSQSARADAKAIDAVKIKIEALQMELQKIADVMVKARTTVDKLASEVASLDALYSKTGKIEYRELLDVAIANYQAAQAYLDSVLAHYTSTKLELIDLMAELEYLIAQK